MLRLLLHGRSLFAMFAALVSLMIASPALAQTTGSIRVTVVDDEMELPIPEASLGLSGANLIGGVQEKFTDVNGEALFTDLPPGNYRLTITKGGFGGTTVENLLVNLNRVTPAMVRLRPGKIDEVIVEAERKAVDTESTTNSQVLTREFLQRIPAGRTYQSAVQTVPGVQNASGGNPSISGGATNENSYILDGANITDPVTGTFSLNFNFDAIQQIEVILGGYMPEYGTSTGGIINLVTQTGTNNLEFMTSAYYQNGNLAPKLDERLSADGIAIAPTGFDQTFETIQISSTLSGPLIRDRAWFYIAYEKARSLIANTGVPQARDYDGHYLLAKLIVQPSTDHRISALFQTNPTTIDNADQGSPFNKAEAQARQAQGGFVSSNKWQWFLSPSMNLDTTVTVQKLFIEVGGVPCTHDLTSDRHPCRPTEEEGYNDWETPGRVGLGGAFSSVNWGTYTFDDRWTYSASTKLQITSVDDPLGGTHDFKFGIDGNQVVWDLLSGYSGNTLLFDINEVAFDPTTLSSYFWFEITGPINYRTTSAEYAAFAQDSWKPVSNLTINYGSRFDSFIARNDLGEPVLRGALLGPRLFAAWDPFKDQRTKIATGYGRFNDTGRLGIAAFTGAANFGSKLYVGEFFNGLVGDEDTIGFLNSQNNLWSYGPKDNLNVSNEPLRAPSVDEIILNLEREVVQDVALYSSMTGRFTRYLYEFDGSNLIFDSDGSALIGSRYGDVSQLYARLRTPLLAKRDYFRWDLGVRKILSRRWQAEASYSYTQSIGSSVSALSGSFAVDPQTQFNYGPLNTDLRHTARGVLAWDLPTDPWTQQITLFFLYTDGYPFERRYPGEAVNVFGTNYFLRVQPRGTYLRFNPNWFVNASFIQNIDVRKGQLQLRFEMQNVLNNRAPEVANAGFIFTNNRLLTVFRQDPLQFLFGVRYEF
jgi:TonB-dependent Receptor Plug Domain/Carboxypeptidase regulatory-like domain